LLREAAEIAALFCREKGQIFALRVPDICGTLLCDRERVIQATVNLIRNAVKFTPIGGSIEFAAIAREEEVELIVSDNGPGIPEHEVGMVFDRFWQGRSLRHLGTGLGLWISKGIVEAHRGKILIETEVGVGSRFIVVIPRRADCHSPFATLRSAGDEPVTRKAT
jgi:signal transduction histidine kinase